MFEAVYANGLPAGYYQDLKTSLMLGSQYSQMDYTLGLKVLDSNGNDANVTVFRGYDNVGWISQPKEIPKEDGYYKYHVSAGSGDAMFSPGGYWLITTPIPGFVKYVIYDLTDPSVPLLEVNDKFYVK